MDLSILKSSKGRLFGVIAPITSKRMGFMWDREAGVGEKKDNLSGFGTSHVFLANEQTRD